MPTWHLGPQSSTGSGLHPSAVSTAATQQQEYHCCTVKSWTMLSVGWITLVCWNCHVTTPTGPHRPCRQPHNSKTIDAAGTGLMTVAGFGSLLSQRSARTTFPDLQNFRPGRVGQGRRAAAHTPHTNSPDRQLLRKQLTPSTTCLPAPCTCAPCMQLYGFRRVFAHTADIFFLRGIANPATVGVGLPRAVCV